MSRPLEDVLFGAPGARPRTGTRVASWLAGAALAFGTGYAIARAAVEGFGERVRARRARLVRPSAAERAEAFGALPTAALDRLHLWPRPARPVAFVAERANWSTHWDGTYVCREVERLAPQGRDVSSLVEQ